MRTDLPVSISAACCGEVKRSRPRSGIGFITTIGTHKRSESKLSFKIFEEKEKLNYRIIRKAKGSSETVGPVTPRLEKSAPWFLFVESDEKRAVFARALSVSIIATEPGPTVMGNVRG